MKSILFRLAAFSIVLMSFAFAQEAAKKAVAATPSSSETAGPEMQKLVMALAGRWTITEKLEPTPRRPNGETASGEERWYALGGGMPLIEEYHSKSADGDAYDSAAIWWNATTHKYQGIWCAAFNEPGCTAFDVKWEANQIMMDGEFQQSGERLSWHEVFTLTSPTSFTQTLDIGKPGGEMKRGPTIFGKKQSE